MSKNKIIIFGIGEYFNKCKEIIYENFEIIAFSDNDKNKQGKFFENKIVINPENILEYKFDYVVITSVYEIEIENQLLRLGVDRTKIIASPELVEKNINESILIKNENVDLKQGNNKKRLLFCIDTLNGGGAEKVTINLLNNLNYEKYDIDLIILCEKGIFFDQIDNYINTKTIFNKNLPMCVVKNYVKRTNNKQLYKRFIDKEYDVEIASIEGISTKIISGSNNKKSKKVAWLHSNIEFYNVTKNMFLNIEEQEECYKQYDNIVVDSQGCKDSLVKTLQIENEKIQIIHTIIEKDSIVGLANEKCIKYKRFTFCACGALIKVKGFERLINVISRLKHNGLECDLIILGEGGERKKLEKQIDDLNLNENVFLYGFVNNPYIYMKACDLFVLSSLSEGLPSVVCEALILGKAIIATKCSGIDELLGDSEYGIVAENSEEGLYNEMKRVMIQPSIIREYEKRAKIKERKLDKNQIINQIEKILS